MAQDAGSNRECRSYSDNGQVNAVAKLIGPHFLARTAQACKYNVSSGFPDACCDFIGKLRCDTAKSGRTNASNLELGKRFSDFCAHQFQDFLSATIEIYGYAFLLRLRKYTVHQQGAIHALGKSGFVDEVQGPADRLAIGDNQIQLVETVEMFGIQDARHHSMNGKR